MTEEQRDLIRKLWWLCTELRAGQTFKDEQLREWEMRARDELQRTSNASDSWDRAMSQTAPLIRDARV